VERGGEITETFELDFQLSDLGKAVKSDLPDQD
jgi:hypothetical protein